MKHTLAAILVAITAMAYTAESPAQGIIKRPPQPAQKETPAVRKPKQRPAASGERKAEQQRREAEERRQREEEQWRVNNEKRVRSENINARAAGNAVDLGLSVMWADRNVGAISQEERGALYAWGETTSKTEFSSSNCSTLTLKLPGDPESSSPDYFSIGGDSRYDAATANWGAPWRMPLPQESAELRDKCKWTPETLNGVRGYRVTGPNGNSIFIARADRIADINGKIEPLRYWESTTPGNGQDAHMFSFYGEKPYVYANREMYLSGGGTSRFTGLAIRPVRIGFAEERKLAQKRQKAIEDSVARSRMQPVDLGLSVKWGSCDVGAKSVSDTGTGFDWGETEEFIIHDSRKFNPKITAVRYDISGEQGKDPSRTILGKHWRMPTRAECEEFVKKCKFRYTRVDGKRGYMVTGPNGNTIFLPTQGNSELLFYWSSTPKVKNGSDTKEAYVIKIDKSKASVTERPINSGTRVRPVYD